GPTNSLLVAPQTAGRPKHDPKPNSCDSDIFVNAFCSSRTESFRPSSYCVILVGTDSKASVAHLLIYLVGHSHNGTQMDRWNRTWALSLLVYLGLMILADSVTDSQALLALADDSQIQPGSWNLRTYDLVLRDSSGNSGAPRTITRTANYISRRYRTVCPYLRCHEQVGTLRHDHQYNEYSCSRYRHTLEWYGHLKTIFISYRNLTVVVLRGHNRSLMTVTGGRLVKCVGGGCHGSVFLVLAMLRNQKPQH
ncbi:unnamed protein product, partial [Fusarium fujikuroi]